MAEENATKMDERIGILLVEYNTLRAAVLQRQTHILQTWGATVTSVIAVFALSGLSSGGKWGLALLVVIAGSVTLKALMSFTYQNARRIAQIEAAINRVSGKKLLAWESRFGPYIWKRAFPCVVAAYQRALEWSNLFE